MLFIQAKDIYIFKSHYIWGELFFNYIENIQEKIAGSLSFVGSLWTTSGEIIPAVKASLTFTYPW